MKKASFSSSSFSMSSAYNAAVCGPTLRRPAPRLAAALTLFLRRGGTLWHWDGDERVLLRGPLPRPPNPLRFYRPVPRPFSRPRPFGIPRNIHRVSCFEATACRSLRPATSPGPWRSCRRALERMREARAGGEG
ncbi:hypothetical protein BHM03_00028241 [Ensete ventricosum]|nr:hypothetical protein BHM03_00028241 [Ensete ventricosum]